MGSDLQRSAQRCVQRLSRADLLCTAVKLHRGMQRSVEIKRAGRRSGKKKKESWKRGKERGASKRS